MIKEHFIYQAIKVFWNPEFFFSFYDSSHGLGLRILSWESKVILSVLDSFILKKLHTQACVLSEGRDRSIAYTQPWHTHRVVQPCCSHSHYRERPRQASAWPPVVREESTPSAHTGTAESSPPWMHCVQILMLPYSFRKIHTRHLNTQL